MNDGVENNLTERKDANEMLSFVDHSVQSLFHVLCQKWIWGAFDVCFLNRLEWEKKGHIFEKDLSGKETLFIPEDVTSEEMKTILENMGKPKDARITRRFLESPKNALANFLFEKELESLVLNMPLPHGRLPRSVSKMLPGFKPGQKTLKETGLIEMLRVEIEEVKKTGDVHLIAEKELDIADVIQMVVREYPFLLNCQHAVEMITSGARNCRGASLHGLALLLSEGIEIPCLIGDLPKHSIIILLLSDDRLVWYDMEAPIYFEIITPEMIGGVSKNGTPLTYADVIAYAKDPTPDGLMIDIIGDEYLEKLFWVKKGQRQFLTLFPPKLGSQMQVLNGIAFELSRLGYQEKEQEDMGPTRKNYYFRQDVEACRLSTGYNPKYEYAYNSMGNAFHELGEYEEAILAYQSSFEINPMNTSCHYGLGRANFALGRKEESILSYKKFIELSDKKDKDELFWINKAKEKIKILEAKK
jgi:hypothetical protein